MDIWTIVLLSPLLTWLTVKEFLCHKLSQICSACRNHNAILRSSVITYHQIFNQINTTGGTSEAGHAYHLGTPEFLVAYVLLNLLCSV